MSYKIVDDVKLYNISQRFLKKNLQLRELCQATTFNYNENFISENGKVEERKYEMYFPAIQVCTVKNATVDMQNGACTLEDQTLFRETISIQKNFFEHVKRKTITLPTKSSNYFKNASVVTHNTNAWHFYFDDLGYLLLLKQQQNIENIVTPPETSSFATNALKLMFPEANFFETKRKLKIDHYTFLTRGRNSQFPNPLVVRALISNFKLDTREIDNSDRSKILYISRSRSLARKIAGEGELHKLIEARGGDVIWLEDHSFEQQVEILSKYNFVIGLHGAGLSSMMWMPENSTVIEILPRVGANACYMALANSCSHHYYSINCESVDGNEFGKSPTKFLNKFLENKFLEMSN